MKVYLAGKISRTDWRHDIFKTLRNSWEDYPVHAEFRYAGPYFLSCDHGCYHGDNSHGVGATPTNDEGQPILYSPDSHNGFLYGCGGAPEDPFPEALYSRRRAVAQKCLGWLIDADIVFCWIDSLDCYGTLVEIGFARAKRKPIFVAVSRELDFRDIWFAIQLGSEARRYSDHRVAWEEFKTWVRRHEHR